jgi:uncharacterized membrane protein (DUF485 family)
MIGRLFEVGAVVSGYGLCGSFALTATQSAEGLSVGVAVLVTAISITAALVWRAAVAFTRIQDQLTEMNRRMDSLPCDKCPPKGQQ